MGLSILGYLHHIGDYLINFYSTCSRGLCVCSCKYLQVPENLIKNLLLELVSNKKEFKKSILFYSQFLDFFSFFNRFIFNNIIIIKKLIKIYNNKFNLNDMDLSPTVPKSCRLNRNLAPTVTKFASRGILIVE